MTDREKAFLVLGYSHGNAEVAITICALSGIHLSLLDEVRKETSEFQERMRKLLSIKPS